MDSRHETLDQEILNKFVDYLNYYINANLDEILTREWLATDIKRIAEFIYRYAHVEIDLASILTKANYLSVDMVMLPNIDDASLGKVNIKKNDFDRMMNGIHEIVDRRNTIDLGKHSFYAGMEKIFDEYAK